MQGSGNLAKYAELVTAWILEDNRQPQLQLVSTVPSCILSICPYVLSLLRETGLQQMKTAAENHN